jgi:GNAT superfamily N-acetyltransferase
LSLTTLEPGTLGAIVTYLDMRQRPKPAPLPESELRLTRWATVDLVKYRILFERVGGPWLWFSRLTMDDTELQAIVGDEGVEVYAVEDPRAIEVGMLELDFREKGQCELSYLGLVPELAGKGRGRWLMAQALTRAWRADIERVHVHTCTLDHPAALGFYQSCGFMPRGQAVETFFDPRLAGLLPRTFAPHIPIRES